MDVNWNMGNFFITAFLKSCWGNKFDILDSISGIWIVDETFSRSLSWLVETSWPVEKWDIIWIVLWYLCVTWQYSLQRCLIKQVELHEMIVVSPFMTCLQLVDIHVLSPRDLVLIDLKHLFYVMLVFIFWWRGSSILLEHLWLMSSLLFDSMLIFPFHWMSSEEILWASWSSWRNTERPLITCFA